jgi:hypothetical protein
MISMKIQYALIADSAEIVNGKLYLMGGGWDHFSARELPVQLRLAVAVGIRIEWDETNIAHPLDIFIEDDDGKELARVNGSMQVGRPSNLPQGGTQLSQMAVTLPLRVDAWGGYRVRISAGEGPDSQGSILPFRVAQKTGTS